MHDLKEATGKVWLTKCGVTTSPDKGDTTAWPSKVSCSACKAQWLRPPPRKRTIKRRNLGGNAVEVA